MADYISGKARAIKDEAESIKGSMDSIKGQLGGIMESIHHINLQTEVIMLNAAR